MFTLAPVAQWIGHPPPKREIPGSSPGGSVYTLWEYFFFIHCASVAFKCESHALHHEKQQRKSSISLVVERWSYVPEVAGSTPARSSFDMYCQFSLVAEHLLCKQKVGSSILPTG